MYALSGKSNSIASNPRLVFLVAAALVLLSVVVLQPCAQPKPRQVPAENPWTGPLVAPIPVLDVSCLGGPVIMAINHGTTIGKLSGAEDAKLKTDLQAATIRSIDIDIGLYSAALNLALAQGACQKHVAELRDAIAILNQERSNVCQFSPFTTKLPEQRRLIIDTNAPYNYGAALNLASQKKNSPMYYIAGISGDDFSVLEHRGIQPITVYILRQRFYNDKDHAAQEPASYYVYIVVQGEAGPGFSNPDN